MAVKLVHLPNIILHGLFKFRVSRLNFSTTGANYLKKIRVETVDNVTTVEGNYVTSERKDKVLPVNNSSNACPLCRLDLDLHYSDVLILSQFMRADGEVLPRRATGVCRNQQWKLKKLVGQAKSAGLMPTLQPDLPDGQPDTSLRSSYKYEKYNVYYEDTVRTPNYKRKKYPWMEDSV